jgi:hypothetical protein
MKRHGDSGQHRIPVLGRAPRSRRGGVHQGQEGAPAEVREARRKGEAAGELLNFAGKIG